MTGSYLLHGARIGKVILHLFEDRLEVKDVDGKELNVDPADVAVDLKNEHRRLNRDPSPLAGQVNFIETLLEKLGISLHPSVPDSPMEKLSTRELPDPSHELALNEQLNEVTEPLSPLPSHEDVNSKLNDLLQNTRSSPKE